MLYKSFPGKQTKDQLIFLEDANDLNVACKNTAELIKYLDSIEGYKHIVGLLDVLPGAITKQPFAIKARQQFTPPKIWEDNEVCYFANFGTNHFEKWDGNSINSGIGGSETAVIKLSEELTEMGLKVTVYADPEKPVVINGITYLPWYYFNIKDYFNIFIQWRIRLDRGRL